MAGFLPASARDLLVSHRDFSPFFVAGTQASIDHKDKLRLGKHLVGVCGVVLAFMSSTHPSVVCVCECVCLVVYSDTTTCITRPEAAARPRESSCVT